MPARVVVFYDWQNVYNSARESFCTYHAPRQHAVWEQSSLVTLVTRPLRYPKGWPTPFRVGERPQEKGIDVALALDFAIMGIRQEYEVGILMSGDTDLKPALEVVAALTETHGTRAEVAAWSAPGQRSRRLSVQIRNLYCHWVGKDVYDRVADLSDYSADS